MNSEKRHHVIEYALFFERLVSNILCSLLNIDFEKSKAFGNGSNSLSFFNKLTLLADINIIGKNDKLKFEHFASIRNQFAHNKDAIDFTTCFNYLRDMNKKLMKLYPEKINELLSPELQNQALFYELYFDLINITSKFINPLMEKHRHNAFNYGNKLLKEVLLETINEFKTKSDVHKDLLDEIVKKTQEKFNSKY